MNKTEIKKLQDKLAQEITWLNGIKSEREYAEAINFISSINNDCEIEPYLKKLVSSVILEFEQKKNDVLIFRRREGDTDIALAALITLMSHRNLRNVDLVDVIGGKSLVSQIINGNRSLTITHIYKLAKFFNVKPSFFI